LGGDDVLDELPLAVRQNVEKLLTLVPGDGGADEVIGVIHGLIVLHEEAAEVGAVALRAKIGVGLHASLEPGEQLAGVSHHADEFAVCKTGFQRIVLRHIRPCREIIELHFGKVGLLLLREGLDDLPNGDGAAVAHLGVRIIEVGDIRGHRIAVQRRRPGRKIALQIAAECIHQRQAVVGKLDIKRSLLFRQRHQLRLLAVVQDIQDVVGHPGEKLRVVAVARRVHIPHILETEEIRHLSGREEGVRPVVAGEEREAGERDGGKLRLVGQRLIGGIAAALTRLRRSCRSAFGFRRCGGTACGGKGTDGHDQRGREGQAHPFDSVHCKRSFQFGAPAPFVKASICPFCEIAVKCATPR
jgi:hypothetical protein